MKNFLNWIRGLVGNNEETSIAIGAFILVFLILASRCARSDELDLRAGSSFGHSSGPVIGLQYLHSLPLQDVDFYAGTLLWGKTNEEPNNWDWHGGLRVCKEHVCASLGATYVQRLDALNGAHTNYNLELSYKIGKFRLSSIDIAHISDAGTSPVNTGRQAWLTSWRLQ